MPSRQLGKKPGGDQNNGKVQKKLMEFHAMVAMHSDLELA